MLKIQKYGLYPPFVFKSWALQMIEADPPCVRDEDVRKHSLLRRSFK